MVETDLDFTGKALSTKSTHTYGHGTGAPKTPITVVDAYTYDHTGRLLTQVQAINNGPGELIVNNDYDELGQLKSKKVGGATAANPVNSAGLQSIDYAYNIRGWLKGINDPSTALGADLFGFKINYDHPEIGTTPALYNGNISETFWKTANDNQLRSYAYGYDALNRILRADFHGGAINLGTSPPTAAAEDYTLAHLIYDKNGNILSLERKGAYFDLSGVAGVDIIDDLSYFYAPQSNTLMKVNDLAYFEGFKNGANGGDDYAYDLNGNLIEDKNKEIVEISYNHLNLPEMIEFVSPPNVERDRIAYIYSAEGVKLQKLVITNNSATIVSTDYAGNYIYGDGVLKMFFHPEGYVEPVDPNDYSQGFEYAYQYKDIWRNVRLSYSDSNNDGNIDPATEIREVASYYPFGMRFGHNVLSGSGNDYKTYQGQEFTDELGLNVHEWKYRISDPAIGRFWQIDPLAEKYYYNSTYAFQENKLGIGVELEGLEVIGFRFLRGLTNFLSGTSQVFDQYLNDNGYGNEGLILSPAENMSPRESLTSYSQGAAKMNSGIEDMTKASIQGGADYTAKVSETISEAATITTIATGGFSAPVTVPAQKTADCVTACAKAVSATVDYSDGNYEAGNKKMLDAATNFALGKAGSRVAKEITKSVENKVEKQVQEVVIEASIDMATEAVKKSVEFEF